MPCVLLNLIDCYEHARESHLPGTALKTVLQLLGTHYSPHQALWAVTCTMATLRQESNLLARAFVTSTRRKAATLCLLDP